MIKIKISGVIKNSFVDYPDNIATVLFTLGCNLDCLYCHNHELLDENNKHYKTENILNFLKKRKKYIDGVVITGGEPTIQSDLISFIKKIKNIGLKIKLDTNGTNPKAIKNILEKELINYIAIDLKVPIKKLNILGLRKNNKKNEYLINLMKTVNLLKKKDDLKIEFRTTFIPNVHTFKNVEELMRIIPDKKNVIYTIQNFRNKNIREFDELPKKGFEDEDLKKFADIAVRYLKKAKIKCNI